MSGRQQSPDVVLIGPPSVADTLRPREALRPPEPDEQGIAGHRFARADHACLRCGRDRWTLKAEGFPPCRRDPTRQPRRVVGIYDWLREGDFLGPGLRH